MQHTYKHRAKQSQSKSYTTIIPRIFMAEFMEFTGRKFWRSSPLHWTVVEVRQLWILKPRSRALSSLWTQLIVHGTSARAASTLETEKVDVVASATAAPTAQVFAGADHNDDKILSHQSSVMTGQPTSRLLGLSVRMPIIHSLIFIIWFWLKMRWSWRWIMIQLDSIMII